MSLILDTYHLESLYLYDKGCEDLVIFQSRKGYMSKKVWEITALECSFEKEPLIEQCVVYRIVHKLYTMSCSVFSVKISNVILSLCIACSYVWLNETCSQDQEPGKVV